MTISLPSHEIYAVDVPEINDFAAEFKYNFFVKDESVDETGGVPENILTRPSGDVDADFVQFATTRAPRFVEFNFVHPRIADVGNAVSDQDCRDNVFDTPREDAFIQENLDKVVSEDHFASHNFMAVNFHDAEIQDKIHFLVSGSIEQATLDEEKSPNITPARAGCNLRQHLPRYIPNIFLSRAANNRKRSTGRKHFRTASAGSRNGGSSRGSKHRKPRRRYTKRSGRTRGGYARLRLRNRYFARLHHVNVNAQINSKVMHDMVNRGIEDPNNQHSDDMLNLSRFSKTLQRFARSRSRLHINERDYKTIVPFVDVCVQRTAHLVNRQPSEIVGYIIDKTEITPDGQAIEHAPIVIENPRASVSADFKVKYNSRYKYTVRTIARFVLPAIDDDTGDIATIAILVSSKPSPPVYVRCRETDAPPPPADLNFTWNYETDKLLVHWCFPSNSQRDIKKFQLFRRRSTDEPFELLKLYDFDDSLVKYPNKERPHPHLVEFLSSPVTFYTDDDFTSQSKYTYAVASIDAHGFGSSYSAQFEVWFDPFKNVLMKRLVSHSGAPKPYPNLYLEADTFVDTMRVSGPGSKRMRLYFNPEYFNLTNDDEEYIRTMATKQQGGCYKLQVINLDNQKSQTIKVTIDDLIKASTRKITYPKHRFGKKRRMRRGRLATSRLRRLAGSRRGG
jgi:hypothetical protein